MAKKNLSIEEARVIGYRLPRYKKGAQHYVEYYVFNPATGTLARRKKMFDFIKNPKERNEAASRFCFEIGNRLKEGWNPFVEQEGSTEYTPILTITEKYNEYLDKLLREGSLREDTVVGYKSKLKILKEWLDSQDVKIYYAYQLDVRSVSRFLDYIFIDRNNSITTRNHYYDWLSLFFKYMLSRQYINVNPIDVINKIPAKKKGKDRTVIPDQQMNMLRDYLMNKHKHYLLACYILHYILIRPKEMTFIRIGDISVKNATIRLYGDNTKNHNDAILTLPKKVLFLMIELHIFDHPSSDYLFSTDFFPGPKQIMGKAFRDYWKYHVRKDLGFPSQYKFYSLKDTGVTNMLKSNLDVLTVRDQARHSSILITDIYTPHDIVEANEFILNYEGKF